MYERSTDSRKSKKSKKIHTAAEASDSQRMGAYRKRRGNSSEASNSSDDSVSVGQSTSARGAELFERQASQERCPHQGTGGRKPQAERSLGVPDPGTDVVKKKDELGLTNRRKGAVYSGTQRARIINRVEHLKASGVAKSKVLKTLRICRSSYYGWQKREHDPQRKPSIRSLTAAENAAIIEYKKRQPQLSHRQISGYLRSDGFWVSPSSCYRMFKALGWVEPRLFREAPWKTARYEPFRPNQIWGEDWTILTIAGVRYYLLTIIDYFSRFIVAWGIVKSVSQREVRNLPALAYMSEDIDQEASTPMIRFDQGSPNMAHSTRRLIEDLEMLFSPARAHRPTDNARQERWYRTVKQEEIYCYPTYPTEQIARYSLGKYIEEYNERRPHQALLNFTPGYVHRMGNKSVLYAQYKKQVQIVKEQRIAINRSQRSQLYGVSN
jgi:putative transposase